MIVQKKLSEDNISILKSCLFWTFIWGLLAHSFALLNLHYVHDSLVISANFIGEGTWEIALGRYFQPIYVFFRGKIATIWLAGILAFLYISIVTFLISDIFCIKKQSLVALLSGFLTTNVTITVLLATYIMGTDTFMFANLMATCSAWCAIKIKKPVPSMITCVLFLTVSLATYQAYFAVFLIIGFLYIFYKLLTADTEKAKLLLHLFTKALVCISLSLILYKIGIKISLKIINGKLAGYIDWNAITNIKTIIPFFFKTYTSFFKTYAHIAFHRSITNVIHIFLLTYTFCIFAKLIYERIKTKNKQDIIIGIIECVLFTLIPFVANIMFFITRGKNSYELTKFSFYIVYVLILVLQPKRFPPAKKIVYALSILIITFNVVTANQVYTKRKLAYDATAYTVTRMLTMMSMEDGYIEGETPVAFIGHFDSNPLFQNYEEFDNVNILVGQKQTSSITYPGTESAFIKYIMNTRIAILPYSDSLFSDSISDMPVFPAKGSCKMIDGMMFVKLSDIPTLPSTNKETSLPPYSFREDEISFYIDNKIISLGKSHLRGWAYHKNDTCRVVIESDGHFYEADIESRPDVQTAFGLDNDKHGFSATVPQKLDNYTLYLINDEKKEIYRAKIES